MLFISSCGCNNLLPDLSPGDIIRMMGEVKDKIVFLSFINLLQYVTGFSGCFPSGLQESFLDWIP